MKKSTTLLWIAAAFLATMLFHQRSKACTQAGDFGKTEVLLCENDSVQLELQNHSGTILRWEYSTDGGATWLALNVHRPSTKLKTRI